MKKMLFPTLLLSALMAGCTKETVEQSSPNQVTNSMLRNHFWKANRFYSATDTFGQDYMLLKDAFWTFKSDNVLLQTGWLMVDPITLKDELVYTYRIEEAGTQIRSRYSGFDQDDVWEITKLNRDTLTVKRLAPLFPMQQDSYLEFITAEKAPFQEKTHLTPLGNTGIGW